LDVEMTEQTPVTNQPVTAVIYARVSWETQREGYSLQTQIEAGYTHAAQHNYKILAEFSDDYTGNSLDRPSLDQLREFVIENHVDVLLVYEVDRFARSLIYLMLLEEEFRRYGVKIEYINDQYGDTEEGQVNKQIHAMLAEYERKKLAERSKRGLRGKAKSGYVNVGSRPPYGYLVRTEPHKQWLVIDDEEAGIVALVFQWYTFGDNSNKPLAINAIARRLTEMKVPTRGDKVAHVIKKQKAGVWTDGMIRHILTCEAYAGIWHYGKTQIVKDATVPRRKPGKKQSLGTKQVPRPREEWIAVSVPSIIDRKTFEFAQERLLSNPRFPNQSLTSHRYLLSKRLRCSKCGYVFRGKTVRGHQYYLCNSQYKKITDCDMPTYHCDLTDETIWNWIKHQLQHPELFSGAVHQEQIARAKTTKPLQNRLLIIQDILNDTDRQLSMLIDLYLGQNIPKEMYLERKIHLDNRLAELDTEKADVLAQLAIVVFSDQQVAEIVAFCAELGEGLEYATFDDKQRCLELLDVQGTAVVENDERVIYITCQLGQQRVALGQILLF
jgi:site-specific DNA recombinase